MKQFIEELKKNPGLAKQAMKVKLTKSGPLQVDVKVGKHKLIFDEDKAIGGGGEGPAPAQMLLASIGGCMINTLTAWSRLLGIKFDAATVTVKGTLDVRGMLGIDENIPSGFQEITVDVKIDSQESAANIKKLIDQTEKSCPVYNTVVAQTPLKVKIASKD